MSQRLTDKVAVVTGASEDPVIWLVLWSFVITLTPVALGLAWKLISGIGRLIGLRLSRAFESAEQWRSLRPLSFDPPVVRHAPRDGPTQERPSLSSRPFRARWGG
jgi:hypothetical protein